MTYTGTIEKILFRNEETAWSVVVLRKEGSDTTVKACGIIPSVREGMTLRIDGEIEDGRFGPTVKVSDCCEVMPSDKEGIEKYLASGLIKHIGPKLAHEIVSAFGEQTLDVLDNHPERLRTVPGIGRKRVDSIIESVKDQKEIRAIMIWLKRYGLTNGLASLIYKSYGNNAIAVLEDNPYVLADDIKGVGFRRADMVAMQLGISPESVFRLRSGLLACLEDKSTEGDTRMPLDELIRKVSSGDYLNIDRQHIEENIAQFLSSTPVKGKITVEDGYAYLPKYHRAESAITGRLRALGAQDLTLRSPDFTCLEADTGVNYSACQREAIAAALKHRVSVITGGPGTGKTVTTSAIIREFERHGLTVLLAAPTGRAAKRMTEVSGHDACTIHRLLEYQNGEFTYGPDCPLTGDALIVDEASMIDTLLMGCLLLAIPDTMHVVFVGDIDQLPPVGAGCPLRDIIESGAVHTTRLTEIYRQAQDSDIVMNAHAVNAGRSPRTDNRPGTDFWFFRCGERQGIANLVADLVTERIPKKFGIAPCDIQVLSPMRKDTDIIGSTLLGRRLQTLLNPDGEPVGKKGDTEFRTGDRIMQTKNNYEKGIFNGDIGTILTKEDEQDEEKTILTADFDGQTVRMSRSDLAHVELAYACTVHKSQGSEYPVVVMPVHESHYVMLRRNLLYTAITRAKRHCILVGTREAAAIAARTEDTYTRQTGLQEKLTKN